MDSALSSVTEFFAAFSSCRINRPSTSATFYEKIHLYPYSIETARKSTMYDRVGSTKPGSIILSGDVLNFDDTGESYIVSTVMHDRIYGGIVRKQLNLVRVLEFVTVKSLVESIVEDYKQITSTVVLADIPFAYKQIETSENKELGTIKNLFYGLFPYNYVFQKENIVETSFGDFTLMEQVLKEEGLSTWIMGEERSDVL